MVLPHNKALYKSPDYLLTYLLTYKTSFFLIHLTYGQLGNYWYSQQLTQTQQNYIK